MSQWNLTLDDIVSVLQRKGYQIESYPTRVPGRKRAKYIDTLYAFLPGHIYGFSQWRPENTASAVFSKLIKEKGAFTKDDFLNTL